MSRLRLYHRGGAGRPIRVAWALEEAGADYELVTISPEQGRGEEHRLRHPLGRVPVLEDADGPLFESTVLCLHVAELYPEAGLLPAAGTHERALAQQWSIFAMTELEPPAIEYYRARDADPERAAKAAERCVRAAVALENALAGSQSYLVGGRLTVADIVASEVLGIAVRLGAIESPPELDAYFESLRARPARERAVARLA